MADEQVDLLKARFGAATDQDLAARMGVERSAVAQWRKRGVPKKYRYVMAHATVVDQITALLRDGLRVQFLGRAENQYFLKAALGMFEAAEGETSDPVLKGVEREAVLLGLMSVAAQATLDGLGKRHCEDDADYLYLMKVLNTGGYPKAIADVFSANRVLNQSPQSAIQP